MAGCTFCVDKPSAVAATMIWEAVMPIYTHAHPCNMPALQPGCCCCRTPFRCEVILTPPPYHPAGVVHILQIATRPLLPLPQVQDDTHTDEAELLLVPLFSNARHDSSCTHEYYIGTCPSTITTPSSSSSSSSGNGKEGLCFFWVAGTDLPPGAEVCVSYGHLRPDQALLMYGLPVDAATAAGSSSSSSSEEEDWMSGLDTMEASLDEPFAPIAGEPLQHWMPGEHSAAPAGGGGVHPGGGGG